MSSLRGWFQRNMWFISKIFKYINKAILFMEANVCSENVKSIETSKDGYMYVCVCIYIYIYIVEIVFYKLSLATILRVQSQEWTS